MAMRYISILFIAFLSISCDRIFKKESEDIQEMNTFVDEQNLVGGDKDEHGCIGSAGYTWSELRQECIRVFERAYRLNAVDQNEENENLSAFILFNDDQSQAELFLPNLNKSIILTKQSKNQYINTSYDFSKETFSLKIDNVLVYQAPQIEEKDIDEVDNLPEGI